MCSFRLETTNLPILNLHKARQQTGARYKSELDLPSIRLIVLHKKHYADTELEYKDLRLGIFGTKPFILFTVPVFDIIIDIILFFLSKPDSGILFLA